MQNDPRYVPVAAALPSVLPPITRVEADRASMKLIRHFGRLGLGSPNQTRRATRSCGLRRCWVSPKQTTGHFKGWGRLIHDCAHVVFAQRHPTFRPHDGGHATLEREMAEYVVAKGWLAGSLRPPEKKKPAPDDRYAALCARLARWESKAKRAATAIKKLRRAKAGYERRLTGQPTASAL